MSTRVGLELTHDTIRAVTVSRWLGTPIESFAMRWDPRAPEDAVAVLRENLGEVSAVAIGVGFEFLHVKHMKLPPVAAVERRRMLLLEPDRFFPIEDTQIVVSVIDGTDLVFAADAILVESWIAALEKWAPVNSVEAAPVAFARALRKAGLRDGKFALPAGQGEYGSIEIEDGVLKSARRSIGEAPRTKQIAEKKNSVAEEYLTAFGAAKGIDGDPDAMLVSSSALTRIRRRRMNTLAVAAINCLLAFAFLVASADRWRSRALDDIEKDIQVITPRAATGAALQSRLAQMDLESSAATNVSASRSDPVAVLTALSRRLPRDATVMSARADGDKWQIDGTAQDAGALIPALAADPRFDDVRFLSASSRFRENGRAYETFSIGFHARPSP